MKNVLWKVFAWIVSRTWIANYLIKRAQRTPYYNLDGYMNRWWLWNRHDDGSSVDEQARADNKTRDRDPRSKFMRRFPSIRIHHILRKDLDRAMHDHSFDFRTIILRGAYREFRLVAQYPDDIMLESYRFRGDTATLDFGGFHNIEWVSEGGVWTMFIGYEYRGTWGFLVDGVKVPWRKHLGYE